MAEPNPPAKARRRPWCIVAIALVLSTLLAGPSMVAFAALAWMLDLNGTQAVVVLLVGTVVVASIGGWLLAPVVGRFVDRL